MDKNMVMSNHFDWTDKNIDFSSKLSLIKPLNKQKRKQYLIIKHTTRSKTEKDLIKSTDFFDMKQIKRAKSFMCLK